MIRDTWGFPTAASSGSTMLVLGRMWPLLDGMRGGSGAAPAVVVCDKMHVVYILL